MTTIYAATADQYLIATILPKIAQNNVNTVRLSVRFDNAWASVTAKRAVFTTSLSPKPYEVILSPSNDCFVPYEVLTETCKLFITIKGTDASGGTKTTTKLTVKVLEGTPVVIVSDSTPNVYEQLLRMNKVLEARMNTFETGSTVEGSEVMGIRTGADGIVYDTAGEAVREQYAKLLTFINKNVAVEGLADVINFDFQFLNYDKRIEGEYWDGVAMKSASGYYRYPIITNIPAGKYYSYGLSTNFTVLENVTTGEIVKLSTLIDGENSFTVDYRFNLYATVSYVSNKGMFTSGQLPPAYLYGAYNITYKNIYDSIENQRIFYCGKTREYTQLKDAIEAAEQYMNSILYVDRGTYDLIEEFGEDFFKDYTTAKGVGIVLKNGIHVIFAQGAKVVCNYTGDNADVQTYFSPFNSGEYGFTLENAHVTSKNTRYTMHDERSGAPIPYKNVYKRCTFIHDSNNVVWGAHQALGGGLGCWGDILIEDCYMSSNNCEDVLTYHNAGYENHNLTEYASNIVIRGCYLEGTIRVNSTGYSKLITKAYVSGNSLLSEAKSGKTTTDAETNVELLAWNNIVRNAG